MQTVNKTQVSPKSLQGETGLSLSWSESQVNTSGSVFGNSSTN